VCGDTSETRFSKRPKSNAAARHAKNALWVQPESGAPALTGGPDIGGRVSPACCAASMACICGYMSAAHCW